MPESLSKKHETKVIILARPTHEPCKTKWRSASYVMSGG